MAGWVDLPDGTRRWQNNDGSYANNAPQQPLVPFGQSPGRRGNLIESAGNYVADNAPIIYGPHGNIQNGLDSIGNNIANFFTQQHGEGVPIIPLGPQAAETIPQALQPMLSLPGPQMSPDYQAVIDRGIGGGSVHGVQYEADPAYQQMADRAVARDAQMQKLLQGAEDRAREGDPRNQHWMARLGEFLSQAAVNPNGLAGLGQVAQGISQRDRDLTNQIEDRVLALQMQGMSSQDAVAQAQAEVLHSQHDATQRTRESQFQADVHNADNAAANARWAAQLQLEGLRQGRQDWMQSMDILFGNAATEGPAAWAVAGELARGDPQMRAQIYNALQLRQYHLGIQGMAAAGALDHAAPEVLNFFNQFGLNRDRLREALAVPGGAAMLADRITADPRWTAVMHQPNTQLLLLPYAHSAQAPAQ